MSSPPADGGGSGGGADAAAAAAAAAAVPPQTPNGDAAADLPAADAAHLADTPRSAVTDFSIDSPDVDAAGAAPGIEGGEDDNLELDYGDDDDDDGDEEENVGASSKRSSAPGEEGEDTDEDSQSFQLAAKTSQIMSSYRDYISEIQSDPIEGGDAEMAKADLERAGHGHGGGLGPIDETVPMETGAPLIAPYRPFQYGMHADDSSNDTPKTSNLHDVSVSGNRFNDVASFEDFYGELNFHPIRKYKHPFLRSKGFKRFVIATVVVVVLLAVIGGVATMQRGGQNDGASNEEAEGWKIPTSTSNSGVGGEDKGVSTATADPGDVPRPFDELEPMGSRANGDQQISERYQEMFVKYEPEWFSPIEGWTGKTYSDAMFFCATQGSSIVCPYEAMCPMGPMAVPAGGLLPGTGAVQWAPVVDRPNEWVNIGHENSCKKYEDMNEEDGPEWGTTGQVDQELTQYIMCCLPKPPEEVGQPNDAPSAIGGAVSVQDDMDAIQASINKYKPKQYKRDDGWQGRTYLEAVHYCDQMDGKKVCPFDAVCPLGIDTQPLGNYGTNPDANGPVWVPILDRGNDWVQVVAAGGGACINWLAEHPEPPEWGVTGMESEPFTRNVLCCDVSDEEVEAMVQESLDATNQGAEYASVAGMYKPAWFGRSDGWEGNTYLAALSFCASGKDMALCPYDALCPSGVDGEPYGGIHIGDTGDPESWAPIRDKVNSWVMVGPDNSCVQYESMHPEPPEWGLSGISVEDITPNVMCCEITALGEAMDDGVAVATTEDTGTVAVGTPEISEAFSFVRGTLDPVWFDRSSGWKGQTYDAAVNFCAAQEHHGKELMLCPYRAYCPMGPQSEPYGGFWGDARGESWAPVSNDNNWWIQIGPENSCVFYNVLFMGDHPSWGSSGEGNEETTRHVMCCDKDAVLHSSEEGGEDTNATPEAIEISGAIPYIGNKYNPIWYDRSSGWGGSSYDDAVSFCDSVQNDGKDLMLCPYQAYCPMGPQNVPYGGFPGDDSNGESWAPVINEYNWWLSLSTENPCMFYNVLAGGAHPNWGVTGEDSEEITEHIMCCDKSEVISVTGGMSGALVGGAPPSGVEADAEAKPAGGGDVAAAPTMETPAKETNDGDYSNPYAYIADVYGPSWFDRTDGWSGRTYDDAVEFCASNQRDGESLMLCPYQAYCPMGPENTPFGGFWSEPNGSWAPVSNSLDQWVAVDSEIPCMLYGEIHKGAYPDWGVTGSNEELTRHIMCCNEHEVISLTGGLGGQPTMSGSAPKPEIQLTPHEKDVVSRFKPFWFGKDDGWDGTSYESAVDFCQSKDSFHLCPIEAYCHRSTDGTKLFGHSKPFNGFQWVPVADRFNQWIQVGEEAQTCVTYDEMYQRDPAWGIDGSEAPLKRHIMCCQGEADVNDKLDGPPAAVASDVDSEVDAWEAFTYAPQWFDRKNGWEGTSYPEAIEFCATNENMILCPYDAYCPNGANYPPLDGIKSDAAGYEFWAPVSNDFNDWVKIDELNVCILWSGMNPGPPEWGTSGGDKATTRHVLCCKPTAGEALDATTQAPSIATDLEVMNDEMGPPPKPSPPATTSTTTTTSSTTTTTTTTKPATTTTTTTKPAATEAATTEAAAIESALVSQTLDEVQEKYVAMWHDRSNGWTGKTYSEAIHFCAMRGSFVPCPYEVYCPLGPGKHVLGGMRAKQTWAPMIDTPNGYVSVGPEDTCMPYNANHPAPPEWGLTGNGSEDVTEAILCCREPEENGFGLILEDEEIVDPDFDADVDRSDAEQAAMDRYHPVWYEKRHGYHGTSHEEAEEFCKNIGGRQLCPIEAYCPNGLPKDIPSSKTALFVDKPSFEGEQWAPISADDGTSLDWVLIGTVNGNPTSTCGTYGDLKEVASWKGTTTTSHHKKNVLCCADEEKVDGDKTLEDLVKDMKKPVWFDSDDGWTGGSWDDAISFCSRQGGRELCKYNAYCPFGEGKPVMGGHAADFDAEGVQWAPMAGDPNEWVMIGAKYANSATTCMTFNWLEGSTPGDWDGGDLAELKKHIMCCSPA